MQKSAFFSRKTTGEIIFDIVNITFLIIFCMTTLYPFWTVFLLSFSNPMEGTTLGFHIWIKEWTTISYRFAFSEYGNIQVAYLNSIFRTVVGVMMILMVTLFAAYPLSKKDFLGRSCFTIFFLITMFFSGGLVPTYLLIRSIGLLDSRWALILPMMANAFYIIIMRNYLMTIDKAYEEAALIDGANYFQILHMIIIPLSKPIIATLALWSAVAHWNSWFDALIYINSGSKVVLQLVLHRLIGGLGADTVDKVDEFASSIHARVPAESLKAAVTMITIGPIILLYPFLQKYFIKGIFIGSLKG